jgi:hypothetical protein
MLRFSDRFLSKAERFPANHHLEMLLLTASDAEASFVDAFVTIRSMTHPALLDRCFPGKISPAGRTSEFFF